MVVATSLTYRTSGKEQIISKFLHTLYWMSLFRDLIILLHYYLTGLNAKKNIKRNAPIPIRSEFFTSWKLGMMRIRNWSWKSSNIETDLKFHHEIGVITINIPYLVELLSSRWVASRIYTKINCLLFLLHHSSLKYSVITNNVPAQLLITILGIINKINYKLI
jgi:hypothetical protein